MLHFLEGETGRPWEVGEFCPATEADVDALDPRQVLETGWHDGVVPIGNPWQPGTGPLARFGWRFLSEKTVRNHVSSIFAELGVTDRASAVARARDAGLCA